MGAWIARVAALFVMCGLACAAELTKTPEQRLILEPAKPVVVDGNLGEWDMLVEGRDWIGCQTVGELPWCRSVATIPGPMIKIHSLLNDFAGYPSFMDRVSETRVYSEGIVHIVLDMPFPFAHRDYVVKYTKSKDGDAIVFDFKATHHPSASSTQDQEPPPSLHVGYLGWV